MTMKFKTVRHTTELRLFAAVFLPTCAFAKLHLFGGVMRRIRVTRALSAVVFSLGFVSLFAQSGQAADALQFFKNYFVTGDYVVGGVGIRGTGVLDTATQKITGSTNSFYATGTIHMSGVPGYVANGVPQHADIVAAYLYWETIATSGADPAVLAKGTFRGLPIVGTQLAQQVPNTLACSGSGGATAIRPAHRRC